MENKNSLHVDCNKKAILIIGAPRGRTTWLRRIMCERRSNRPANAGRRAPVTTKSLPATGSVHFYENRSFWRPKEPRSGVHFQCKRGCLTFAYLSHSSSLGALVASRRRDPNERAAPKYPFLTYNNDRCMCQRRPLTWTEQKN